MNKSTREVRALAGQYTEDAITVLINVMRGSPDDKARISAACAILDRAHGKPTQGIDLIRADELTARLAALEVDFNES